MLDSNVEYYNKNADSFFEGSINVDMSYTRDKFMSFLPDNAVVLDAGCGSGRDSKAFLDAGFDVTAFDASEEMCKRASEYIGRPMNIIWRMDNPIPAKYLKKTNKLEVG